MKNKIEIVYYDNLNIKIEVENFDYFKSLEEHFTEFVDGFQYMWKYKMGMWDGKVCLFNTVKKTLPVGLLTDLLKFNKEKYPELEYKIDPEIKKLFNAKKLEPKYNLSLYPREYQKDCIEISLNFSRGIIRVATAGGKCGLDIEVEVDIPEELYEKKFKDYEKI